MRTPEMRINALNIADLSELPPPNPEAVPPSYSEQPTPTQTKFQDPAILSMARPSVASTPLKKEAPGVLQGVDINAKRETSAVDGMRALGIVDSAVPKVATPETQRRRRRQNKSKGQNILDENHVEGSPVTAQKNHGKGWRNTPILQSTASFQPFKALKKKGGADNGWASEDVTEEMGEFDFENNLAKFDKQTIFDQMRKEDAVDEADRLVSHNRLPKPGTAGGKNLHHSENVLDMASAAAPPAADFWNSEADVDGEEEKQAVEARNGQAAHRSDSKSGPTRRSQSRKASTAAGGQPMSRVNSGMRGVSLPSRRSTPRSGYRSADRQNRQPGFYTAPSDRRVESISTLQMLNLENIAANELGFSEALMAENAGRGIAEVAVTAMADPALKVRYELAAAASPDPSSSTGSTIVVVAGNNKSSIRALAAARHLRNKNFNVIVCVVGVERDKDLLDDLRRQVQLYRSFGGKLLNKSEFFEHLRGKGTSGAVSVSLIIDALLGLTMSFEELRSGDQASVYELMEWANRNEAFVLAVDVPSGIDPTSGKISIIDGSPLFVKPRYVAAVGAPKRGLVEALAGHAEGEGHEGDWRVFVVDLGLGNAVWRKAGAKVRKGIDFDGKWVAEMRYFGEPVEEEEE